MLYSLENIRICLFQQKIFVRRALIRKFRKNLDLIEKTHYMVASLTKSLMKIFYSNLKNILLANDLQHFRLVKFRVEVLATRLTGQ